MFEVDGLQGVECIECRVLNGESFRWRTFISLWMAFSGLGANSPFSSTFQSSGGASGICVRVQGSALRRHQRCNLAWCQPRGTALLLRWPQQQRRKHWPGFGFRVEGFGVRVEGFGFRSSGGRRGLNQGSRRDSVGLRREREKKR